MPTARTSLDPDGIYARLGLRPGASREDIVAAYRGKARILHPDVAGTGDAAAFVALKAAYDILSDRNQRDAYDRNARQASMRPAGPAPFTPRPAYAAPQPAPARPPRFTDLPVAAWIVLGAFLSLCVIEAVLHLRGDAPAVSRPEIKPNAATVAPLSPAARQAAMYGPEPARLPGSPNFYVVPAGGPTVLWRLDREKGTLLPIGELPPFSSVQAVRLYRQNGLLEVLLQDQATGFVQASRLRPGDARVARQAFCAYNAGAVPVDGEVLERHGQGNGSLRMENRTVQPAVVKLRDGSGGVALSVFLSPGGHADLRGIPAGTYRPDFAIGELWSRGCNTFAAGSRAQRLDGTLAVPGGAFVVSADLAATDISDQVFEQK